MMAPIQSSGSERFSAALFDASLLTLEPPAWRLFFWPSLHTRINPDGRWHVLCVSCPDVSQRGTCRSGYVASLATLNMEMEDDLLTPFCQGVGVALVKSW